MNIQEKPTTTPNFKQYELNGITGVMVGKNQPMTVL